MSVGVTRSLNIVTTATEYEKAIPRPVAGRLRTQRLAQRSHFVNTREAAESGTLYGTPDEVSAKLQALRDLGVGVLNSAGGIASLRRFAHEVMPAFASEARAPDRGLSAIRRTYTRTSLMPTRIRVLSGRQKRSIMGL